MQGYKYCFLKFGFFKGRGPAAEGKAVGPSLKLEVGFRRKNSEHAMHPARGRRILMLRLCRWPLYFVEAVNV